MFYMKLLHTGIVDIVHTRYAYTDSISTKIHNSIKKHLTFFYFYYEISKRPDTQIIINCLHFIYT